MKFKHFIEKVYHYNFSVKTVPNIPELYFKPYGMLNNSDLIHELLKYQFDSEAINELVFDNIHRAMNYPILLIYVNGLEPFYFHLIEQIQIKIYFAPYDLSGLTRFIFNCQYIDIKFKKLLLLSSLTNNIPAIYNIVDIYSCPEVEDSTINYLYHIDLDVLAKHEFISFVRYLSMDKLEKCFDKWYTYFSNSDKISYSLLPIICIMSYKYSFDKLIDNLFINADNLAYQKYIIKYANLSEEKKLTYESQLAINKLFL